MAPAVFLRQPLSGIGTTTAYFPLLYRVLFPLRRGHGSDEAPLRLDFLGDILAQGTVAFVPH